MAAKATTPENIRQSVDESLKKLGTLPDLLLIHNPFVPEQGKIGEFWTILEDLVYDGTLKGVSLGVSNFRPQDLKAVLDVARIKPVANRKHLPSFSLTQKSSSTRTSSRSWNRSSRCTPSTASSPSRTARSPRCCGTPPAGRSSLCSRRLGRASGSTPRRCFFCGRCSGVSWR